MHATALIFACASLPRSAVAGKHVLEVGSYNVNGSVRPFVIANAPASYIGVDQSPQYGFVDLVLSAEQLVNHFGESTFDVVISTEMLEHTENWRTVIDEMKSVLRPGGLLVLTCRGPGFPRHNFPHDYWRFTVDDFCRIFADFDIETLMADFRPGVLFSGRKSDRPRTELTPITVASVQKQFKARRMKY